MITEKIGNKTMVFLYDESGNVDCIWYNGDKYYLIRNTYGDVVQLRDEDNAVVAYYLYNAFGYLISVTDANGSTIKSTSHIAHLNPIRYRGYYYDAELKMYYLYSRYYNPEWGRFISADVLVGMDLSELNLFAYCANDPVNCVDPYGYCSQTGCHCVNGCSEECLCDTPCDPFEGLEELPLPEVDEPGTDNTQNSGAGGGGSSNRVIVSKKDRGGQRHTPNQSAVIDLARENKHGVTQSSAQILIEWAIEYGLNFHETARHENRSGLWSRVWHIKIFNIHIPVLDWGNDND